MSRRHAAMPFFATCVLAGLALSGPAAAQELLFHFPLDGSAAVQGSAAGDARLYVLDDGPPPATVPGKFGNALYFSGNAAIAMPFELDHTVYPRVTVTAWVKVDGQSTGERTVFSAGNGNVPRLSVYGDRASFVSARAALMFDAAMPRDEWVFVAGVIDVPGARIATHQADDHRVKDNLNIYNLYGPSGYRNPDDPSVPFGPYVFIGSHGFGQWRANKMSIDDVRVYASALTAEQVAAIRDAGTGSQAVAASSDTGACQRSGDCAPGTYCAVDGACYPDSQLPVGYVPPPDGPGLAGRWEYVAVSEGSFMSPGGGIAIWLEFTGPDSNLSGTVQSAALIFGGTVDGKEPMSNVVRSGNTVTFSSPSIPSFTGAISSDGSTITARGLDPSSAMVFKRVDTTGAALQPTSSASNTTTSPTQSSGGTPSFYQVDGIEIAPEDRPAGPLDLTYASEEEALAAAEARERQAAQDELARQQNELEAQRVMESNAPVREETTTDLRPIPVGEPRFSGVAGHVGQNKRTLDLRDQFLHQIAWFESSDSPCRIAIAGLDVASETQLDVGCPRNIRPFGLFLSDQSRSVELTDSVIGSIAVCNNNPRALYNEALRLKGIRVSGERIADDGTTTYIPASDEDSLRNCAVWSIPNLCPVNPTHLATGLIVHSNDSGSTGDNEDIVGLQLICRQVGLR